MKAILWCCVDEDHAGRINYDWRTLSYTRRDSKWLFLPKEGPYSEWKYWAKFGYKCVKVEVVINIL